MKQLIDLENWNRKEHFEFFSQMEEPFYGVVTEIDVTIAYQEAKRKNIPFFNYYLHKVLFAVNETENFRLRIDGEQIFLHEKIDASATVMRADKTFGFSFMQYTENENNFSAYANKEIERVQNTSGLLLNSNWKENIIHFSAVPFINFSGLTHARSFTWPDSCPKISVGKIFEKDHRKFFNIAVYVHHGLVDGYHIGLFLENLQKSLDK